MGMQISLNGGDGWNSLKEWRGETLWKSGRVDCFVLSQISSVINSFYGKEGYPPLTVVEDELKVRVDQVLKLYKEFLIQSVLNVCF